MHGTINNCLCILLLIKNLTMIYILYSYDLDGSNLQMLKASEDFDTIVDASKDSGFDVSGLSPTLNASANTYNGIVGWYVLGVKDSKVYQINKIDVKVPENKELFALFEKHESIDPADVGQTYDVEPVCLKESYEEVFGYFQHLLVDDYPKDYQIDASQEFEEYSSFTTDEDIEYRSLKINVE